MQKLSFLFGVCLLAASSSISAQAQVFGQNLVVNGDAEAGPGGDGITHAASIPGWTATGTPDVYAYATAYKNVHGVSPANIGPAARGNNYFAGGSGAASATLVQTIDVSAGATTIDAGGVTYDLNGYLGGFLGDNDTSNVSVILKDANNVSLGSATLSAITVTDRASATALYYRRAIAQVPVGVRKVIVTINFIKGSGAINESYVDNVALILNATSARALVGSNLILNPNADAAPGYDTSQPISTSADLPNWVRSTYFAADKYTDSGGDLTPTSPGPTARGANYFYGGTTTAAGTQIGTAYQDIDISGLITQVDAGTVTYNASAWVGGWDGQDDNATVTIQFNNFIGAILDQVTLGPVLSAERAGVSELVQKSATGTIIHAARVIRVLITATRTAGTSNDGIADNLSLVLSSSAIPACTFTLPTTTGNAGNGTSTGSFAINTPDQSCVWTATSNASWITITPPSSGTGNGTVNYSVAANAGAARQGTITAGNQTFIITQTAAAGGVGLLALNRPYLNFGYAGTVITGPQPILVTFFGGLPTGWTATSNQANIVVSPTSGTGNGTFTVTATPGASGIITVSAPTTTNSPQQVTINVATVSVTKPSGSFDTPVDGTTGIAGAIAVTGWALDNIEVSNVGVWREKIGTEAVNANGLVFIGNATFVADARPDVYGLNTSTAENYRAGWGYALLTNFLPNTAGTGASGNGTYKLHAIATDKSGLTTDLGTKTITVDNAHASKPFGTIDTPDQGGSAGGNQFVNFGWALTQNPYFIPTDGSTITVTVDGVVLAHPVYNQQRSDIADSFPGLANSTGAIGYYILDTTKLLNGVHTIGWVVYDNQGRGDGVGSRFFNVFNAGGVSGAAPEQTSLAAFKDEGIQVQRGWDMRREATPIFADDDSVYRVDIEELGRMELHGGFVGGAQMIGSELHGLPVGSTIQNGIFYWQPGPGFQGNYDLKLIRANSEAVSVRVRIRPQAFSGGRMSAEQ